jgi:hypothetical protein
MHGRKEEGKKIKQKKRREEKRDGRRAEERRAEKSRHAMAVWTEREGEAAEKGTHQRYG